MTDPATDVLALCAQVTARLAVLSAVTIATPGDGDVVRAVGTPALLVAPAAERPARGAVGDDDGPGASVTSEVHVYCVATSRNTRGGGDALSRLRPVRNAVRARLAGWVPEGSHEPMRYAGGRLVDPRGWLSEGRSVWQDAYVISGFAAQESAG